MHVAHTCNSLESTDTSAESKGMSCTITIKNGELVMGIYESGYNNYTKLESRREAAKRAYTGLLERE